MKEEARLSVRIPAELKNWLDTMKEKELSSINYEIVRSIRERKERHEREVA